jgi:hypothetical protein
MSDDILACPICLERFNETQHSPLILECGHTFCKECIISLQNNKRDLRCPQCKRIESRPVDKLPKNYIISNVSIKTADLARRTSDNLRCRFHLSEDVKYISHVTKQLYCSECLRSSNPTDLQPIEIHTLPSQLKRFNELYNNTTPDELGTRSEILTHLAEAMEGHKLRMVESLETGYLRAMQNIESQYTSSKMKFTQIFDNEINKLMDFKVMMDLLRDMKELNFSLDDIGTKMPLNRALDAVGTFNSLNNLGVITDIKKIPESPIELSYKWEVPQGFCEVPIAISETPLALIQGVGNNKDCIENKLSRFNEPFNRWGIFEGRNQVEAVTFTANQIIYLTGIGVGNTFHPQRTVNLESVCILEGPSTDSPAVYTDSNIPLYYNLGLDKVVKLNFKHPVKISANADYTIKIILKGEAGVYRGNITKRTLLGYNGVVFTFKSANYASDDVKNGENADDGPIFDIYYKLGLHLDMHDIKLSRFSGVHGEWPISKPNQVEAFSFVFSGPVVLTGIGVGNAVEDNRDSFVKSVKVLRGRSTAGEEVYSSDETVQLKSIPYSITKLEFGSEVFLKENSIYTLRIVISGNSPVYHGKNFIGTIIVTDGLEFKCFECELGGSDTREGSNHNDGPIIELYFSPNYMNNIFDIRTLPKNLTQLAGGESQLSRFEEIDKQWHLNSESQVESFAFNFSEDVLITAIGCGNCTRLGSYNTVETLEIRVGNSTAGPLLYSSAHTYCLFNHSDSKHVVKLKLERPVKLEARINYTLRIVMRGEGKAYKGTKFRGATITRPDGVIFKSMKSILGGQDKRNGDNESAGPIFDIYYINLNSKYSLQDYNKLLVKLFPTMRNLNSNFALNTEPYFEEYIVSRYSATGSSWHINTNGKQVEAISFMVNSQIYLTGIGLANAFEQGKQTSIKKLEIRQTKSTRGFLVYRHDSEVKLSFTGADSNFVKVSINSRVKIMVDTWYTLRVKYMPGTPISRGTCVNNAPSANGVQFSFEKACYEDDDMENGSHEIHGPLKDFYFTV